MARREASYHLASLVVILTAQDWSGARYCRNVTFSVLAYLLVQQKRYPTVMTYKNSCRAQKAILRYGAIIPSFCLSPYTKHCDFAPHSYYIMPFGLATGS
ncbi:MAG: hypothetical protein ACLPX5_00875 [Dissulfurispiraceae bacterium]